MKKSMIARREAARERLDGYVRQKVLPTLGIPGVEFELVVPSEGTRSLVFYINTPERRFVLKSFDDSRRAVRTFLAGSHMSKVGAPVPKLLFSDLSPSARIRTGFVHIVEEWIDGENLYEVEATTDRIAEAARTLASLHAIKRDRWGLLVPNVGRRKGYFEGINGRLKRRFLNLLDATPELEPMRPLLGWFDQHRELIDARTSFSLCHLRVNGTNILFGPEGRAYLIDLITARYGSPSVDIERALYRWCGDDPETSDAFLAAYFGAERSDERAAWEATRAYYHGSFHLSQAYRAGKSYRRRLRHKKATSKRCRRLRQRVEKHLNGMLDALCADPTRAPLTDVVATCRQSISEFAAAAPSRARA